MVFLKNFDVYPDLLDAGYISLPNYGFAGAKQEPLAVSFPGFAAEVSREVIPLERNGIQLYLARYQTTASEAKTPILLVHGLTYSSHEFDVDFADYSLARYLANNGYAVWVIDIVGYGSSRRWPMGSRPIRIMRRRILPQLPGKLRNLPG